MSEGQLYWWMLVGSYASALVAAPSIERALELMEEEWPRRGWQESPDCVDDEGEPMPATLPGLPTAEGVYHASGE